MELPWCLSGCDLYQESGLVDADLSAILDPLSCNQVMLIRRSFKGCALLPSLLFQFHLTDGITEPGGFPGISLVKNPSASAGDTGLIPGSRRSPGVGNDNPLHSSVLA